MITIDPNVSIMFDYQNDDFHYCQEAIYGASGYVLQEGKCRSGVGLSLTEMNWKQVLVDNSIDPDAEFTQQETLDNMLIIMQAIASAKTANMGGIITILEARQTAINILVTQADSDVNP